MADLCVGCRGYGPTLLFSLDQVGDVLQTGVPAVVRIGEGMASPTFTSQVTVIGHFWDPLTAQQNKTRHYGFSADLEPQHESLKRHFIPAEENAWMQN